MDPVDGCTDNTADNYNSNANVDDGSCVYNCDNLDASTVCTGPQAGYVLKTGTYLAGDESSCCVEPDNTDNVCKFDETQLNTWDNLADHDGLIYSKNDLSGLMLVSGFSPTTRDDCYASISDEAKLALGANVNAARLPMDAFSLQKQPLLVLSLHKSRFF